jgi:hypothetical protein
MISKKNAVNYANQILKKYKIKTMGTVFVDFEGYIAFDVKLNEKRINKKGHSKFKKKRHRFHRFITEKRLNKKLKRKESVHHKDHDRLNNKPNNLEVMLEIDHLKLHPRIATRPDDKRHLWRETRKGENNPNYNNGHAHPNYIHISKIKLRNTINKYRKPCLIQRALNISEQTYYRKCKKYGFEHRCVDNGLVPLIPT